MSPNQNSSLIFKILVIGGIVAALVYLFHPGVGQFSLIINGEPVAEPLFRFAAIPALLAVMFFTGILMVLAFLGVGMFLFMAVLVFILFGIFFVAPYFWPVLAIIFLVIIVMSIDNKKNSP